VSAVALPPGWVAQVSAYPAEGGPAGADWARGVPRTIERALDTWGLRVDGAPRTGRTAVVVPVLRDDEPLALKLDWPHPEARHEHLALRHWDGTGAVRLVAARPREGLLLLERLEAAADLGAVWADEACEVIGGLLGRLHVPAPPQVERLTDHLPPRLERMRRHAALPRRVVTRTLGLARDLLSDPGPDVLLHTDLHDENVLRSADRRWVAIGPEPLAGHPGFELFPALRHRVAEMGSGAALRWSVRHRLALLAEAAGIDEDEARAWTLLRAGLATSRATREDEDEVTTCIALGKALDD
jgi:streptomycin 6-kinase